MITSATVECYSQDSDDTRHDSNPTDGDRVAAVGAYSHVDQHDADGTGSRVDIVTRRDSSVHRYRRPMLGPRDDISNCTNSGTWSDGICG